MTDYKEVTGEIKVPANTGEAGFLQTIKQLIRRPRMQEITIDARGAVRFRRFALEGEEVEGPNNNFGVDLNDLQPWHVIRNAPLEALPNPRSPNAAVAVGYMFDCVAKDRLRPLAFVVNPGSVFWSWYQFTTGSKLSDESQLFGLPLLTDREVPDSVLVLSAGYGRDAAFIDTQKSYKLEIPQYQPPTTDVEVIP
jgi:hypothetical protein